MRTVPLALFVVMIVAGCVDADPVPKGEVDTAGRMQATSGFVAHDGGGDVTLVPNGTLDEPASCTLYRNDLAYPEDTCTVRDGASSQHPPVAADWHITAHWEGSDAGAEDTMERLHEKSVVAFDADGNAVAQWDGRDEAAYHPGFMMAVE